MNVLAPEQYKETLLFLGTAGMIAPVFQRLRISPVIGYLLAGAALGPHGLGALASGSNGLQILALENVHAIEPVAEFGVVFLLFMIGLELSFERLTRMRRLVFGLGSLQLGGAILVLALIAALLGAPPAEATLIGAALALSSTAVVIPVLAERKRLGTSAGRTVFSVLLFQDLMVAPLLVLVTVLGLRGGDIWLTLATTLLPALTGLLVVIFGGRLVIRPLFHHVAASGSAEFFMAACLFVVIGTGVVTAASGLSMGLGAFIAGLLLAETEFRREIEVLIDPFKGLLLGLFFVAIGAGLDVARLIEAPAMTLGLAAGFILVKTALTFIAARALKLSWRVALESALLLAAGGEFAFVLTGTSVEARVLHPELAADINLAVTLSLFAIPAIAPLARRLSRQLPKVEPELKVPPPEATRAGAVIVVGYGRVGQLVGDMLRKHTLPYLALDENIATVREARRQGQPVTWGNARRVEMLERCGLMSAGALVITLDNADAAEEITRIVRDRRPDLTLVARARDAERAARLYKLGVTDAVPETIEASLQLSEAVLADLGVPMGLVIASIHERRDEFRKLLQPVTEKGKANRAKRISSRLKDLRRRADLAKQEADRADAGET